MSVAELIWIIIQIVIGYNLLVPLCILFLSWLRKKTNAAATILPLLRESDFAIIITAYEQTDLLPDVVGSILKSNYNNFLVYVVADNCDIRDLHFSDNRIIVLKPGKVLASNTASHFYAINNFRRSHTHLTIIDSDNLVHSEYLCELNKVFSQGFEAVQGVRKAKNLDSFYARLDAARDLYYHYYDGLTLFNAGSSATLAGSGMAFTVALYKECLQDFSISGAGFDKVLQYRIVKKGLRIAYSETAIVYDQKTADHRQLVKQRARWINTWFRYFSFGFNLIRKGITGMNWNQFLFGLVLLRPPLFIFLILSVLFLAINIWIFPLVALVWLVAIFLFVIGFFISLLRSETDKRIYQSLGFIPVFIYYQLLSLLKIKNANKYSVATRHAYKKLPDNS